jgi:hypothetical protein
MPQIIHSAQILQGYSMHRGPQFLALGGAIMSTAYGSSDVAYVAPRVTSSPTYQAYRILQICFFVAPIMAGFDKFFHVLVNWDMYLAPSVNRLLGGHGHEFMLAAGVIEIIAGIGIAVKPKVFGYIVGVWLLGIVANLLLMQTYYDIALRDFGLALAAFALARLSPLFDPAPRAVQS